MIRKAIISGGGTGGHIFPAISIAEALRRRYPDIDILFIGAEGRMEMQRVPQAGFPIQGLKIRGLDRKHLWRNIGVLRDFIRALVSARDIIRSFQPEVVIGVGGYASAPTLKAAQSLGIPTLIQEQNSYAGVTNKFLARRATKICVAYPEMERFFPKDKIVLTGNPLRPAIEHLSVSRDEALSYFGLPADTKRVVLVVGGSLGARSINESIGSRLKEWADSGVGLIWQTGTSFEEKARRLLEGYNFPVWSAAFIQRMDLAYALADVVVDDAFGCAHRGHASNAGIAKYLETVAGYLIEKEIAFIGKALETPERPFVAILGGAKVSEKINVIDNLIDRADTLIIGGGMANTFLAAQGLNVGTSLTEPDKYDLARKL